MQINLLGLDYWQKEGVESAMLGKHIIGYDESGYNGGYEYHYDPEHKDRDGHSGGGWYMTDHGWARGSDGGKHSPTTAIRNEPKVKPTAKLKNAVMRHSKNIEEFVSSRITDFSLASSTVRKQLSNHRRECEFFDSWIVGFADKKKTQVAHLLSAMTAYLYHLSPDFRNEGKEIPNFSQEEKEAAKEYIAGEQEIVRMTGLVNEDDTITLFRNTDGNQLEGLRPSGKRSSYKGNNLESWSTNPNLDLSLDGRPKTKIMAKVPLHAIIASCIGRERGRGFQFKDKGECEIMACGAFIEEVMVVGGSHGINAQTRMRYLQEAKANMQRFSRQENTNNNLKGRKSSFRRIRLTQRLKYWDL